MKKQDLLLLMIAICGELPTHLAGCIVGSDSYAAALITKLKKEGYVSVRNRDGCRGYVLKAKGRRYILETQEADTAFFLQGSSQTSHVKSERNKRIRLHRMSEAWIFFWKMGIQVFHSQKPVLGAGTENDGENLTAYYGSLEFKSDAEGIKGSRACGVLLSGKSVYVVYNTMAQRMKWARKMECAMRTWTERLFWKRGSYHTADALILGKNPEFLKELLESDGGIQKNLFQVDDVYERYYYLPMCKEAEVQVRLLLDKDKRGRLYQFLSGALAKKKEKEYAIYDGYDIKGDPVYFCHELELRHLIRVKQETLWQQKGTVLCLDYQEKVLKAYFGEHIRIQVVITEKLTEYLQQDA